MEPQLPKPQIGQEMPSFERPKPDSSESFKVPSAGESIAAPIETGRETKEAFQGGPSGDPVVALPPTPPPAPVLTPAQPADDQISGVSTPAAAGDDDLIEKEWVEKAKQIVAKTRDDPHAQDEAIGRLQADYLKKRYGKVISDR